MFKKGYTYGEVLLYLYEIPESRANITNIKNNTTLVDPIYFKEVIEWLIKDDLIIKTNENLLKDKKLVNEDVYRISYKGYGFVKDLKEKRTFRFFNSAVIAIACISIVCSIWINISNRNSITKVEITKYPYLPNIKRYDTTKPIVKPTKAPASNAGISETRIGKP